MPLSKAGKKIKAKLEKQYGEKKGEGIFYAMENKGEIPGMNKMKGYAKGGDTKANKKKTEDKKDKPKKGREQATRRMSSGAQQYVRGETSSDKRKTIIRQAEAEGRRQSGRYSEAEAALDRAFIDEANESLSGIRRSLAAMRNEDQTKDEDRANRRRGMAKGGMVKGYAKGGMVKSTGKMNTGIKKCGE
jgi:hypothetical protein